MICLSMPTPTDLLDLLRHVRRRLDGDVSLEALAARSGWSSFHLHRAFRRVVELEWWQSVTVRGLLNLTALAVVEAEGARPDVRAAAE